jgi:hypothetical protein
MNATREATGEGSKWKWHKCERVVGIGLSSNASKSLSYAKASITPHPEPKAKILPGRKTTRYISRVLARCHHRFRWFAK